VKIYHLNSKALFVASAAITLLGVQLAAADPMGPPPQAPIVNELPPYEILATVHSAGFEPLGRPLRRGRIYWLHAINRRGQDVALTIDAASGRILSATPASGQYDPAYDPPRPYGAPPYGRMYEAPPYGQAYGAAGPYAYRPYTYGPYAYGPPEAPGGEDAPAYGRSQSYSPQGYAPQGYGPQAYGPQRYDARGVYGDEDGLPTGTIAPSSPPRSAVTTRPQTPLPRPRPQEATVASSTISPAPAAAPQTAPAQAVAPAAEDKGDTAPQKPAEQPSTNLPPVTPLD
jgi:hypothetical protein